MTFKDWKTECKLLICEQAQSKQLVVYDYNKFINDWGWGFDYGWTPKEAVDVANKDYKTTI